MKERILDELYEWRSAMAVNGLYHHWTYRFINFIIVKLGGDNDR